MQITDSQGPTVLDLMCTQEVLETKKNPKHQKINFMNYPDTSI